MIASPSEKSVFLYALGLVTSGERRAYLDDACRGAPELRAGVEALLAAHDRLGGLAPGPAVTGSAPEDGSGATTVELPAAAPDVGAVVAGRYELLEMIGEGGMGTVFMAEQTEPVRRRVAVKLVRVGMDSRQVAARFEAERQALALMDHPNIAKVFDGGTMADGRPFFAMELVRGVPITEYCDARRLSIRARLELFAAVCDAVQHAHQKGVIHRDLKPSNVLVAEPDGRPVPKVIDFGIAKATGEPLTDQTLCTGLGTVVGTPEYMSPEQAELTDPDIDTRTDVYSLGVILYELLTGATPLEARGAALLERLRRVREEEPPRPSARLSSTGPEQPPIAARRGAEQRGLARQVRGELDWTVMKALEKDRSRRYETAAALAADVRHHLAGEPVLACPPSAAYRLKKVVARNKGAILAASLVLVALVVGIVGTGWQAVQAIRERDKKQDALRELGDEQQKTRDALSRSLLTSSELAFDKGQLLGEHGDADLALLWLARSLRLSPQDAGELRAAIRMGLGAWQGQITSVQTILSHEGAVESAVFAPDGRILTVGRRQSTVVVQQWDPAGHDLVHQLVLPGVPEQCEAALAFSPDADRLFCLAGGGADGSLQLVDLSTGRVLRKTKLAPGRVATRAVFSPDGRLVLVGFCVGEEATTASTGLSQLFDAATGNPVGPAIEHTRPVFAVAFHPDGKSYVTECGYWANGTEKVEARFWDLNGKPVREPLEHPCMAQSVAFSPDGAWLLTGHADRNARLWELKSGEFRVLSHEGPVLSVSFSPDPDGARLLTGSADGTVRIWDRAGRLLRQPLRHGHQVYSAKFSRNGRSIVVGVLGENRSRVWDLAGQATGQEHDPSVFPLAVSPDRKTTLTLTSAHTAQLRDVATGQPVGKPLAHDRPVLIEGVAIHPGQRHACSSDRRRAITLDANNVARLWDVQTGVNWRLTPDPGQLAQSKFFAAAFSPDSKMAVTGNFAGVAQVWDAENGQFRHANVRHAVGPVFNAVFHPQGTLLVTAGADNAAGFWDPDTGQAAGTALLHPGCVFAAAFSPDGKTIATGGIDPVAQIWRVAGRERLRRLVGHQGGVNSLAFSPGGAFILTGSQDKTARLWDSATGKPIGRPFDHPEPVARVTFGFDGKTVLTATDEAIVRSWPTPIPVTGTAGEIELWAQVVTGMELEADGGVRILDAVEWQQRRSALPERVTAPNGGGR